MSKNKELPAQPLKVADEMHEARILGQLEPMEYVAEPMAKHEVGDETVMVDDAGKFLYHHSKAKIEGKDIETTADIIQYLLNGRKGASLTYKGVRIFLKGTREETLMEESMDAEAYANMIGRRRT